MAADKFGNAFWTRLAAPMLAGDLTATTAVAAPAALQGGQFRVVCGSEIMIVTGGETTTTWTVTRGAEGTTAVAHATGASIAHVLTAVLPAEVVDARGGYATLGAKVKSRGWDIRDYGALGDATTDDVAIAAAIAAVSPGGRVLIPAGVFDFSTTINPTGKAIIIEGVGAPIPNTQSASRLNWTGLAGPAVVMGESTILRNLEIKNSGTGAVGVDWDGGANGAMEHVSVRDFATNVDVGATTAVVGPVLRNVQAWYGAIGFRFRHVTYHMTMDHCHAVKNTDVNMELGGTGSGETVHSAQVISCMFDQPVDNQRDCIRLINVNGLNLIGNYYEHHGATYAIKVPSTAVLAWGINVIGGWFSGGGTATYAIHLDNSVAHLAVTGALAQDSGYVNPSYFVRDDAFAQLLVMNNNYRPAGMASLSSVTAAGITALNNWGPSGLEAQIGTTAVSVFGSGSATWTKPAWAKFVTVVCIGAGGGGGSGRRGAASTTNRCGGGGGGGGAYSENTFLAADLPTSVNVTVGSGGVGGASRTTDDTDGATGGVGDDTFFGATAATAYISARRAVGGAGGTNATSANGGAVGMGRTYNGDAGANGGNGAGVAKAVGGLLLTRGGGGGGGVTITTDAEGAGGTGFWPSDLWSRTSPANGGAVHANGGPGVVAPSSTSPGASGGGGGGGHAAAAGNGGDGVAIGAGGGGGGGSTNGFASGKGGDGGPGICIVSSWA